MGVDIRHSCMGIVSTCRGWGGVGTMDRRLCSLYVRACVCVLPRWLRLGGEVDGVPLDDDRDGELTRAMRVGFLVRGPG